MNTVPYYSFDIPFEIVYRNNSTSDPVRPHTHNALEIFFTLSDLPDVLLNDTVSGVASGTLIIIPPYNIHQLFTQKLTRYERYIITVSTDWLSNVLGSDPELMRYASPSGQPKMISLTGSQVTELRHKLDHYLDRDSAPSVSGYADFFTVLGALDELITEGLAGQQTALSISSSQKKVNGIIAYINSHLCEPLTVERIAGEFYLNRDYMARLFKDHTHSTVGHYIAVQRTSLAQKLLSDGHTVTEVQNRLGFSSYAYFFRFFKKMTGISPSHYRKV